jgi:pimeloyl-ACP methyl ester carboxylesterase
VSASGVPSQHRLIVRGTPVELLSDGTGPALLFLHGAGGAGRWLPFHAELARRFTVYLPKHPGHGGAPAAEWIEHISDLAFHYLDLLDELKLDRVHLVGSSLGGWIAAEMATMASHRLKSLALIAPVGIKVDGWIYPFLFAMELPQLVATVFHDQAKALALAPGDLTSIDTLAELYRERAALARVSWNPYLYNPLLRRRLGRITAPTLLCGSPATVRDKLRVFSDELSAGIVCSGLPAGSHEATLDMMEMFAREVMPHFREDAAVDETAGIGR